MAAKRYRIIVKNTTYEAEVEEQGPSTAIVSVGSRKLKVELGPSTHPSAQQHDPTAHNSNTVSARLPGKVEEILAAKGSTVKAGEELAVMNSMKMRVAINAPRNAVIAEILVNEGDVVAKDQELIRLQPQD